MAVTLSERDVYVGAHVTDEVKEKLRYAASRRRMSMSALVSTILEDYLNREDEAPAPEAARSNRRGLVDRVNQVTDTHAETEPPLPFEPHDQHVHGETCKSS